MSEPDNSGSDSAQLSGEDEEPEIVLSMVDEDAEMVESILTDNGVKREVIRRAE